MSYTGKGVMGREEPCEIRQEEVRFGSEDEAI
jgi:hypothetical protein